MPRDCVINFDHIQTVSKAKTGSPITSLSKAKFEQVSREIAFALELT